MHDGLLSMNELQERGWTDRLVRTFPRGRIGPFLPPSTKGPPEAPVFRYTPLMEIERRPHLLRENQWSVGYPARLKGSVRTD
jgi:hypothetical protein